MKRARNDKRVPFVVSRPNDHASLVTPTRARNGKGGPFIVSRPANVAGFNTHFRKINASATFRSRVKVVVPFSCCFIATGRPLARDTFLVGTGMLTVTRRFLIGTPRPSLPFQLISG